MRLASTVLACSTAALVSLGLVVMVSSEIEIGPGSPAGRQILLCGLGLVVAAGVALCDYRWLKRISWLPYFLAAGLLVAVLVLGVKKGGATRWLVFQGFSVQPSELAKVALVIALAHYGERFQRWMPTWWKGFVIPGALAGLLVLLVFSGEDYGTSLLLSSVAAAMLLVGGVRWRHLLPVAALGLVVFALFVANNDNRLNRVRSWWRPELASADDRLQAERTKTALGAGGLTGKGLAQGENYAIIPVVQSDFVLALVGEELGLAGTASVVVAFMLFVLAGVSIAWNARDTFGLLLASGLTLLVGLQAAINVGVVTEVLPNKGIALPFLSKGGSNLLVMLVLVGLLFSVARTTVRERFEDEPGAECDELPRTL